MVHDRVQPSQFTEKEHNCVRLSNPPTQNSNKKKKKNKKRKNAVFPDPEERDIPAVSKPVELATSNDVTNAESFSELIQLPGDEEIIPTFIFSGKTQKKSHADSSCPQ